MTVSNTAMWKMLNKLDLRLKKLLRAAEQDREDVARAREEWRENQPKLDPKLERWVAS